MPPTPSETKPDPAPPSMHGTSPQLSITKFNLPEVLKLRAPAGEEGIEEAPMGL